MKVTMKAMKLRVSGSELYKALKKALIQRTLLEAKVCKARKAQTLATKIFDALRLKPPDTNPEKGETCDMEVLENAVSFRW